MNAIKQLDDLIKVQCSPGNYDSNPYMLGLANGLILARAVLSNEEPKYMDNPVKFLDDMENSTDE